MTTVIPNSTFLDGDFLPHHAKSVTSRFYEYLNLNIEVLFFLTTALICFDDVHIPLMTLESILSPHH